MGEKETETETTTEEKQPVKNADSIPGLKKHQQQQNKDIISTYPAKDTILTINTSNIDILKGTTQKPSLLHPYERESWLM